MQATYTIICELVTFSVSRVIVTSRYSHIVFRPLYQVCQAPGCAIYFQNAMQILERHQYEVRYKFIMSRTIGYHISYAAK